MIRAHPSGRLKPLLLCCCCFVGSALALASELYIYTSPNGQAVVTDRPINLPGYSLQQNQISARNAGLSLRDEASANQRTLIDRHVKNAAYLYDVDSALINAVIRQESAFNINARSYKGAMGLMQLMPATAAQYQVIDILDPKQNIYAGTQHLRYLLYRYSNVSLALAAYNAGETAVAKYQGIPPYPETQDYVKKVLNWYRQYQAR